MAPFNRRLHVLNPKQLKQFHKAYNDLSKNDYLDSFVITGCLRFGRIMAEIGGINRFDIMLYLLNLQFLPRNNTSPMALNPRLQGSFHPATVFDATRNTATCTNSNAQK